jgi:dihydroneopterin aldolase
MPRPELATEAEFAEDAAQRDPHDLYRIIINDLVLPWRLGVRGHEEKRLQRVRLNIELSLTGLPDPTADDYRQVLCYEDIVEKIRVMAESGHVRLAETVAQKVAALCLSDHRVERATVRVEKLDAILDAASVGVEITQTRR